MPQRTAPFAGAEVTRALRHAQPLLWVNPTLPRTPPASIELSGRTIGAAELQQARKRLVRFAPLLAQLFPEELAESGGIVESPLLRADALRAAAGLAEDAGALWLKCDHQLEVAGSIKARGGFHEVLELAERIAIQHGLMAADTRVLAQPAAREVFARYTVSVGSTGNLGMSIGLIAAALGFRAVVHMSADAKAWKKARLRAHGVEVIEHSGDYAAAVAAGRAQAQADALQHFVDDEQSLSLLLGYACAAFALKEQLRGAGVRVDGDSPLIVYLPCGVGGAPAGITLGLKQVFGAHVHCFWAEPVQSPCCLVQAIAGDDTHPSVYDWGLTNRTEADGLAVPRGSLLARAITRALVSGIYTVEDDALFRAVQAAHAAMGLRLEPSAAAGLAGPAMLLHSEGGRTWQQRSGMVASLASATHLVWTTGGSLVPDVEFGGFLERGGAAPRG